jgi:hypothetical protein
MLVHYPRRAPEIILSKFLKLSFYGFFKLSNSFPKTLSLFPKDPITLSQRPYHSFPKTLSLFPKKTLSLFPKDPITLSQRPYHSFPKTLSLFPIDPITLSQRPYHSFPKTLSTKTYLCVERTNFYQN